jgi:hypothetical protein
VSNTLKLIPLPIFSYNPAITREAKIYLSDNGIGSI